MSDNAQNDGVHLAKQTDDNNTNQSGFQVQLPRTMSFRDVFLVIVAVVTVLSTWGAFKTKVSVLTEKVNTTQTQIEKLSSVIEEQQSQSVESLSELEQRIRKVEVELYKLKVRTNQSEKQIENLNRK